MSLFVGRSVKKKSFFSENQAWWATVQCRGGFLSYDPHNVCTSTSIFSSISTRGGGGGGGPKIVFQEISEPPLKVGAVDKEASSKQCEMDQLLRYIPLDQPTL